MVNYYTKLRHTSLNTSVFYITVLQWQVERIQHFTSIMTLIECFIWHDGDMCCTKLYTCMQTDPSIEVHSGLHAMRIKNALLHEHVCRICVTLTCSVYLRHGKNSLTCQACLQGKHLLHSWEPRCRHMLSEISLFAILVCLRKCGMNGRQQTPLSMQIMGYSRN